MSAHRTMSRCNPRWLLSRRCADWFERPYWSAGAATTIGPKGGVAEVGLGVTPPFYSPLLAEDFVVVGSVPT